MSVVNFRCPYCGRTELHQAGRKLPEMCGQCRYDRSRLDCQAAPVDFIRPGPMPPPMPPPLLPLPNPAIRNPTVEKIRRLERSGRFSLMFWQTSLVIAALIALWKYSPVIERFFQNPDAGIIAAALPDPDQILLTEHLKQTLDDPNFDFVRADRVDGAVVRRAWQLEMSDLVRRWELTVRNHPDALFDGIPAKELHDTMRAVRQTILDLERFDAQRLFRLRYRAKNVFGAMELRDEVFTLEGKKVVASVPMSRPFSPYYEPDNTDPRVWFIQHELSDGGPLVSRAKTFEAIKERPGRVWESRP